MTDKPKLQTYNFLTENKSIEDILNQPNTTLKNKKEVFKKRHGGLTVKISNDVLTTNEPINKESSTALNNQSSQTQIVSTEVATQTEEIYDKKSTDNLTKYSYNSLTILEDEKIRELRKKIFLLEENLENNLKQKKFRERNQKK